MKAEVGYLRGHINVGVLNHYMYVEECAPPAPTSRDTLSWNLAAAVVGNLICVMMLDLKISVE